MRVAPLLLLLAPVSLALAQDTSAVGSNEDFPAVRPDVIISIRAHWTGAEVVQISMVEADYPPETLRKQVEDLCARLGHPPTGLSLAPYVVDGGSQKLKFLQASFGTAGLTDEDGNANLTPILQAFAGVPEPHTIKGLEIFYSEFDPPIKGPKTFTSPAVKIAGRRDSSPSQVEYAVELLSQDPKDLQVETKPVVGEPTAITVPIQKSSPVLQWCLILIAGVAAGALVYFLLIKRLSGSPSSSL